ncbi:AAA family ATPase [Azospirillum sp. RWY-5-1]|uniref:AAA family ATPase n=1 Tax=Azospirillum oleiclasticum TaxID=2735135 RepID=A0ABX2T889_9PROT|nr:AAA family ATPase [Azospirillum oleiclasticum]NYZ13359.1 AAA family ATPase [Azospirillum oleiclasticum]NYZ20520.1 AAA family ATPase [Azospirillum oleiclasticum]
MVTPKDADPEIDRGAAAAEDAAKAPQIDPVEAAAEVILRRALDAAPDLKKALAAAGVAVVVQMPGAGWMGPVKTVWGRVVWPHSDVDQDGDSIKTPFWRFPAHHTAWVVYRRDGTQKDLSPGRGNAGVSAALSAGCPVVGFSPVPERHLPRDLMRVADLRIVIPPLDAAALAETLGVLTGTLPTAALSETLCRRIALEDLRLAWRPGTDANGYMGRLRRLLEAKAASTGVVLGQLHGMDEAVTWGMALVRDLAEYRRGVLPWSAVDRGVLLYGPPGTGKTTFAKALAGSCGVPLISGTLSQWQAAGYLNDLLKVMRAAFAEARAAAPAILFIDEIDSFGDRTRFTHDNKDYSIQVVNGLLEELDGIGGREGVVVIGACNHPGRLDPAITRSGRLDRTIAIPLPDQQALARILRHHLGGDLPEADLSKASLLALGGTGADCERWVRGARRRARHGGRDLVIDDVLDEIRGLQRARTADEAYRYAVHEAGHALVLVVEEPGALVSASIRQTADTQGGVVADRRDRKPVTRKEVAGRLRMLLAGRAAEEVVFGDVSTGSGGNASSDLAQATMLAAAALNAYGLDDGVDGLLWRGLPTPDTLPATLSLRPDMGAQVSAMLADGYAEAKDLIQRHRQELECIARLLVERETADGTEIEILVYGGEDGDAIATPP